MSVAKSEIRDINNLKVNRYGKYISRAAIEQEVVDQLFGECPIVLVHGNGGLGKSALVYNLLLKIIEGQYSGDTEVDKVFWFSDADFPGELTAQKFINEVKYFCDVGGSTKMHNSVESDLTGLSMLFDTSRISIIVIDNFETVRDPDLINYILYNVPIGCKIILTSKYSMGYFRELGIISDRLEDGIVEIPLPKLSLSEWRTVFTEKQNSSQSLKNWVAHIANDELNEILEQVYIKLNGNVFGMLSVILQISKRGITCFRDILTMFNEEGLFKESFDRILSNSWELLSADAQSVLLASVLQGLAYLDFDLIHDFTGIGSVSAKMPQFGSQLDLAVNECIDLNLMEQEYKKGKINCYLNPIVHSYLFFQISRKASEFTAKSTIDFSEFQGIFNQWISRYVRLAKEIGFCYNDTKKMCFFDVPERRNALMMALEYCYNSGRYQEYYEISHNLRYFFYTRAIWERGENCIHIKCANAAKQIGDSKGEFEALVYYLNIASKYGQLDQADSYLGRAEALLETCGISKTSFGDSFFRFQHTLGLFRYSKGDLQSALGIWNDLLSQPICTTNIHDVDAAKRWRLKCLLKIGEIDSPQVISLCRDLLEEAKQHHFDRGIVDYSLIITDEYLKQNEFDKAKEALNYISELVNVTNDALYTGRYYYCMALCTGETEEGNQFLLRAIEIFNNHNFRSEIEQILRRLNDEHIFMKVLGKIERPLTCV